ncbi:neurofilament medium polypeptide [Drosophila gunungcola]|uniref:neurofilament medium polypeptide n=1 Tax=Drosophila gunungcola TaxID=103775 RepID=UPI0022E401D4|nr:neurofilament medium polypeptide [Drosophila gunungcola]
MSGSKAKKGGKGDQIPKPISIKKEKLEEDRTLHPISHYIDDRLELVKQIFGTLKPKTIMNLAPEFLKKTPLDEIEALCLEELLCLSTKRLKAIIEGTRCPTDTESSEDSDVEQKEEHISLEEISSDSDIGGQESRRTKKKLRAKKTNNGNENKESGGQMSVLELLELQARARAIRSQLAMEPITKIEVKSDDDDENPAEKVQRKEKRSTKNKESGKRKSQETKATREDTSHPPAEADSTSKEQQAPRKKIKIKRNYRQTSKSPDKEAAAPPPPSETSVTIKDTSKPSRSNSRSASPDVITIQMEPETLLISDSTDDEATKQKSKKTTEPVVVEPPAPVVESEPEEGEVRDEPEEPAKSEEQAEPEGPANTEELTQPEEPEKNIEPTKKEAPKTSDEPEKCTEKKKLSEEASLAIHNPPAEAKQSTISEPATLDDEDQNDDVISIGGDLEMIEEMTKEDEPLPVSIKNEKKEKLPDPEDMDNDVISLDTSEDERDKLQRTDSESWRTRYMKSSKVSQVLAESRLGKRVRDKLKKSKRSKVAASDEQAEAEKQPVSFTSKHEDGSIEQYQELLQHRQRKTSSSSKGDK